MTQLEVFECYFAAEHGNEMHQQQRKVAEILLGLAETDKEVHHFIFGRRSGWSTLLHTLDKFANNGIEYKRWIDQPAY